jgi:hypothetical protein
MPAKPLPLLSSFLIPSSLSSHPSRTRSTMFLLLYGYVAHSQRLMHRHLEGRPSLSVARRGVHELRQRGEGHSHSRHWIKDYMLQQQEAQNNKLHHLPQPDQVYRSNLSQMYRPLQRCLGRRPMFQTGKVRVLTEERYQGGVVAVIGLFLFLC